jgi:hypothetical protein
MNATNVIKFLNFLKIIFMAAKFVNIKFAKDARSKGRNKS